METPAKFKVIGIERGKETVIHFKNGIQITPRNVNQRSSNNLFGTKADILELQKSINDTAAKRSFNGSTVKMTTISSRVLLNKEEIERLHKSYSQMEEKEKKTICWSKNRLSTKESHQYDVDIEMLKNEMELLNNKKTSDREIIFNSTEQLSRHERIIVDLCERVEELKKIDKSKETPPGC